ncbi:MAG: YHS domain-containing protein [Bacteroidetes bacterium]|nr:YHS domain-containing protein [Bacteroidota bacterium]MBU2585242.1 YHS domain-containing protein [Bacteroidota bacterium]
MEKDLVCGMHLMNIEDAEKIEYKGKFYYFCSASCKEKFNKEPNRYINKENTKKHEH